MGGSRRPCLLAGSVQFNIIHTYTAPLESAAAPAVSAVAAAAFAGLVRFPQRPDGQRHDGDQYGDHNNAPKDSGHDRILLSEPVNSRRPRPGLSGGNGLTEFDTAPRLASSNSKAALSLPLLTGVVKGFFNMVQGLFT